MIIKKIAELLHVPEEYLTGEIEDFDVSLSASEVDILLNFKENPSTANLRDVLKLMHGKNSKELDKIAQSLKSME